MDSKAALATPIQSYLGQATVASKVRPTTDDVRSSPVISGRQAMVSDLSEKADTCTAVATSSHSVLRKLPPSADSGA